MLGWPEGVPPCSAGPRRSPAPIRRPGAGSLQRGTAAALAAAKVRENLGYRAGVAGRHLKKNIHYSKIRGNFIVLHNYHKIISRKF
jgi:hypothetical protein